jgi:hypothetical protein
MLAFQYVFIFMKIYAAFTLHVTEWGSRNLNEVTGTKEEVYTDSESEADPEDDTDPCIEVEWNEEIEESSSSSVAAAPTGKPWHKQRVGRVGVLFLVAGIAGVAGLILLAVNSTAPSISMVQVNSTLLENSTLVEN